MSLSIRAAAFALVLTWAAPGLTQKIATETAVFAGGCFWCTEVDFDKVDGVVSTTSGYIGGKVDNPTYRQVVGGSTGHTEAVQVEFDPKRVSYKQLVDIFWRTIDPVDAGGQFCDRGDSYRSGVFTSGAEQKVVANKSKQDLIASGRFKQPIATEVTADAKFFKAEDYHQDFYKKDPGRYYSYRAGCGRDARIKALWGAEAGGKVATQ
jgi:peptide-methionine (S)-S-oxide reductase